VNIEIRRNGRCTRRRASLLGKLSLHRVPVEFDSDANGGLEPTKIGMVIVLSFISHDFPPNDVILSEMLVPFYGKCAVKRDVH